MNHSYIEKMLSLYQKLSKYEQKWVDRLAAVHMFCGRRTKELRRKLEINRTDPTEWDLNMALAHATDLWVNFDSYAEPKGL